MWEECHPAFAKTRTHQLGLLTAFGRRTITRGICARALQHFDWSKFYRFFSKDRWSPIVLTHQILNHLSRFLQPGSPLVVGVDDTNALKTGKKIPASGYFYDPKSPPFARSSKWAIRIITISAMLTPYGLFAAARGILLKFKVAPTLSKLPKNASKDEMKHYNKLLRSWSIATQLVEQLYL